LYPAGEMLTDFAEHAVETVTIHSEGRCHFKPISIAEAVAFKAANADCTVIAGATDIGVLINKGIRDPKVVLNLSGLSDLRKMQLSSTAIDAGALVTIAGLEEICETALPEYAGFLEYFGSPPIKNAATIGGNIANGSPIGDSMPALLILDAEIELTGTQGSRRININQFYIGYRKTVMTADEIITAVHIPLPVRDEYFWLHKVSRRKDLDISAFSAAIRMKVDAGKITDCRIAYGGVAPTIVRLSAVESFLSNKDFNEATFRDAVKVAMDEVRPISDVRGSADYRSQLAGNILMKFFIESNAKHTSGPSDVNGNGHPASNGERVGKSHPNNRLNGEE
jgi:xanthine dehydrogenase small subunit